MRRDEAFGAVHLLGMGARGVTGLVELTHGALAGRAFGAVERVGGSVGGSVVGVVRAIHDATSWTAYRSVNAGLTVGAVVGGTVAAARASGEGSLTEHRGAHTAIALTNGLHGDRYARWSHPLALGMAVRRDGRDVPVDADDLAAAFPEARPDLVIFLHGLVETEHSWDWRSAHVHGAPDVTYGTLLEADHDCSAVYIRYNSGLAIADNGTHLDALLGELVAAWPVPVRSVSLVGHSMGGLVCRCAMAARPWPPAGRSDGWTGEDGMAGSDHSSDWRALLDATVWLGSPVDGAPMERGAVELAAFAERVPEVSWLAAILRSRSIGIQDLHGRTTPDLPDGLVVRQFAVAAAMTPERFGLDDHLGDGLVGVGSARARRTAPPADHTGHPDDHHPVTVTVRGRWHQDLLNDPEVYRHLVEWLVRERPVGSVAVRPGRA
jgi:hypothetical protein